MPDSFNFLQNKYTKWYFSIILAAQNRTIVGYIEKHHIVPKSLGGSNRKENLVGLTAREHFICHWLLTKMVDKTSKHKMLAAVHRMSVQKNHFQARPKITGKKYQLIREQWAREHSNWFKGKFSGKNNPNFGNTMSVESKRKISEAKLGKKLGPMRQGTKQKIRKSHLGVSKNNSQSIKKSWETTRQDRVGENHPMFGKQHSLETKNKMKAASAKRWTLEARAAFSAKKKELNRIKREIKKCLD